MSDLQKLITNGKISKLKTHLEKKSTQIYIILYFLLMRTIKVYISHQGHYQSRRSSAKWLDRVAFSGGGEQDKNGEISHWSWRPYWRWEWAAELCWPITVFLPTVIQQSLTARLSTTPPTTACVESRSNVMFSQNWHGVHGFDDGGTVGQFGGHSHVGLVQSRCERAKLVSR